MTPISRNRATTSRYAINRHAAARHMVAGETREPVLILDDALCDPAPLIADAVAADFQPAEAFGSGYPGLLAPVPAAYVEGILRAVHPLVERIFGMSGVAPTQATCNFALVTLTPESLIIEQRLPHADQLDPLQLAFVHYLCDESLGGTGFFRHRATGIARISEANWPHYDASLAAEIARDPPDAAYIAGPHRLFDCIGAVPARRNRLIVYRSALLHSGLIARPDLLSSDPSRGRLTANFFVPYRLARTFAQ